MPAPIEALGEVWSSTLARALFATPLYFDAREPSTPEAARWSNVVRLLREEREARTRGRAVDALVESPVVEVPWALIEALMVESEWRDPVQEAVIDIWLDSSPAGTPQNRP